MTEQLETTMDARARRAADLAGVIEERGYACFPRLGWADLTGERLVQARRELFQAVEDLADGGRDVEFVELDAGDGPAHYFYFADSPPEWRTPHRRADPE